MPYKILIPEEVENINDKENTTTWWIEKIYKVTVDDKTGQVNEQK